MNIRGSICRVEPITSLEAISAIKFLLRNNHRDLAIFTVGINTAFRASDLVKMTVGDFRGKVTGDCLMVREKKTGKVRKIVLNNAVLSVVGPLITKRDGDYIFRSGFNDGDGPLRVETVSRLVKSWCRKVGLMGNYGSHSLRKTFGYMQRTQAGVDIPTLMTIFGHATQAQTLAYLCIQQQEITDVYMNEW